MLVMIYGLASQMGRVCREHLEHRNFSRVKKYCFAEKPELTTNFKQWEYVTKRTFRLRTDPLFRYEVAGIHVGYSRAAIANAVSAESDSYLTFSTDDISFLWEIKRIHTDQVHLIYAYMEESALIEAFKKDGKKPQEMETRIEISRQVKQRYLENSDLFDHTIVYGGEDSLFNMQSLTKQIDAIIARHVQKEQDEPTIQYADVVIPCADEDRPVYEELRAWMEANGVSVFDNEQLGDNPGERVQRMEKAICHAKMVVPVFSKAFVHAMGIHRRLIIDIIEAYGKQAIPIQINSSPGAPHLWYSDTCKIHADSWEEDIEYAAGVVCNILDMQNTIQRYAEQVDTYLKVGMYENALAVQEQHYRACDELGDNSMLLGSTEKYMELLVRLQRYEEAMDLVITALGYFGCHESVVQWAVVCARCMDMDEEQLIARITEQTDYMTEEYRAQILTNFANMTKTLRHMAKTPALIATPDETDIANYGERALELFESMVADAPTISRQDLIDGYRRILDYCQQVQLRGAVPDACIKRIKALQDLVKAEEEMPNAATTALKVYLGKAYPESGYYDVFLSYKSESEVQAREVYDFLIASGKEVFFAPVTLNYIGNTDYTEEIMKAIEHAAHMVVVCDNPAYVTYRWVKREWETFLKKKKGNLVLVLKGKPSENADRVPDEFEKRQILSLSDYKMHLLAFLRKTE